MRKRNPWKEVEWWKGTVRFPRSVYEKVMATAQEERRSLNQQLTVLLEEAIKSREGS